MVQMHTCMYEHVRFKAGLSTIIDTTHVAHASITFSCVVRFHVSLQC